MNKQDAVIKLENVNRRIDRNRHAIDCAKADNEAMRGLVAQLQAFIDAPEKPGSLLPICAFEKETRMQFPVPFPNHNPDKWAEAFMTFIELRQQPGSEAPIDGKRQWTCDDTDDLETGSSIIQSALKSMQLIPCFDTQVDYQSAIKTIGADRILQMVHTFQGVE